MRPISLRTAHLDKMLPRIMKRHSGKPLATRLVVNRTFGSAMSIIEDLREISLSGLEHELDIFERFVFSENFSEPCREQLKLAIMISCHIPKLCARTFHLDTFKYIANTQLTIWLKP